MESLKQLFAKFLLFWAGLKSWQKASLFAAAFLVLGLLALAVYGMGSSSYEPLYSGLDINDQAAIVAYLKENKILYQVDAAANAILLPKEHVYDVRLALADAGIPKGGRVGFEIFDESKMGVSEFQQKITYVRALEGELERTISHVEGVELAKVSLVIPEQRLFLAQQMPSTASVLLRLKPGTRLGLVQVKGVIHLVSKSVDGLQPENVTVVDTTGRILSDMLSDDPFIYGPDGPNSVTSVQRELERQLERELEHKVRYALENVFGNGKSVVNIKVDLDLDKRSVVAREYYPNAETGQGVPRSVNKMEESYTGQQTPPGGAPGTTTNLPGYAVNTQNAESEYNKSDATTNYEITTRESNEVVTPGGIRRVTASVLVSAEPDDPRLTGLQELVEPIIGYNAERGDRVVVRATPFNEDWKRAMEEEMRQDRMYRLVVASVLALLIFACVAMTGLWWYRRRRARRALEAMQKETKRVPTIQEMLTSPDLLAFQGEMAVLEEQLKAYARSNPGEVANLVNEWLSSDL
ncbi:MAG: flagellar M-ring protein FliF [Synergistaceae bacterium]|jgi:flagellar M-ring protein FliF|nr:flagellar M-ring protein FliF [Synergistaceae bacterium]